MPAPVQPRQRILKPETADEPLRRDAEGAAANILDRPSRKGKGFRKLGNGDNGAISLSYLNDLVCLQRDRGYEGDA
jgi:hypothetical protein